METEDFSLKQSESNMESAAQDEAEDTNDNLVMEKRRRPYIPPPHPLLPKSQLPTEPVRTGAPIPFLKMTYAKGGSNILLEKQCTQDKSQEVKELEQEVWSKGKRSFKALFTQDLKS